MKLIHRVRNTRLSKLRATPEQELLQYMEHVYPTVSSYINTFWYVLFYISITLFYAVGTCVLVMYLIGYSVPVIIHCGLCGLFIIMIFIPEMEKCTSMVGIAMWVCYIRCKGKLVTFFNN